MEKINVNTTESNREKERPVLGQTADGATVRDRAFSHFHTEDGVVTEKLLATALKKIDAGGRSHIAEEVKFDYAIGYTSCVKTQPDDEVVMVFRKGRPGRTPMNKSRASRVTNSLAIILNKDPEFGDDNYVLITCFPGEIATREPWDPGISSDEERKECEEFWATHSLAYDEKVIDMERTEKFNSMSEEEKELELLSEKILYSGVFIDADDLYSKAPSLLENRVKTPHITTCFRPKEADELNLNSLGKDVRISAIGYGNNGKNEGLLAKLESDDPETQKACDKIEKPFITLSLAPGARAIDTGSLEFVTLDEPIELTGKYGLFMQGKEVFEIEKPGGD